MAKSGEKGIGIVDDVTDAFEKVRHGDIKGLVAAHPYMIGALVLGAAALILSNFLPSPGKLLALGGGTAGLTAIAASVFGDKNKPLIDQVMGLFDGNGPQHQEPR